MTLAETALAILILLVTPGPTNTLLAIAGAERGWPGAIRLIPAELAGYLATVAPLAGLGAGLVRDVPQLRVAITVVAAAWVVRLAVAMWRGPAAATGITVTARRIALTTLLNPKALVFGLVLIPSSESGLAASLGLFAVEVVGVAMLWAAMGSVLADRGGARTGLPRAWRRAASIWLGLLAAYLVGRVALA